MVSASSLALRQQFNNPAQQRETVTLGMWIFLATEVMLFGALFTAYSVYRIYYTPAFTHASGEMEYWMGAVNTAVLICSSFTMALGVHSAEAGKKRLTVLFLLLTMLIGCIFLGIKFWEHYRHYLDHKVPGINFQEAGALGPREQMFFFLYFAMTGLHAFHMLVGLGVLSVMVLRVVFGSISREYHTPIEIAGLYWHFVDVIWVVLFAIFYIPGAHLR